MKSWITTIAVLFVATSPVGAQAGGQVRPDLERYDVVLDESHVWAVTHRAGLLSFLGHEHAIVPGEWSADLCLADPVPEGAHGSVVIRTGSLVIDSDSARSLAGLDGGPGDEDRREVQRKMLDAEHLDATRHPEIRLDLRAAGSAADGTVDARGRLTLHGVEREVQVPLTVAREDGRLRLDGHLRVRQTDYGIEPESTAGVVKVSDEIDLYFALAARATGEPCGRADGGPAGRTR